MTRICKCCDLAELEVRRREFMGVAVDFLHCPICDVRRCAKCRAPQQVRLAVCHRCGELVP